MDSANYENMMAARSNPLPGERLGDIRPENALTGAVGGIMFLAAARHIYMASAGEWQDYAAAFAMLLAGGLMTHSIY